jgi:hypothetical protein
MHSQIVFFSLPFYTVMRIEGFGMRIQRVSPALPNSVFSLPFHSAHS